MNIGFSGAINSDLTEFVMEWRKASGGKPILGMLLGWEMARNG